VAGIAGLGTDHDSSYGPNLIKSMYQADILTLNVFSFYLTYSTSAYLDLGFIDNTAMKDPSNLIMHDTGDSYFWSGTITAIRFGDADADAWQLDPLEGITDSGTSCILTPSKYFEWILEQMEA